MNEGKGDTPCARSRYVLDGHGGYEISGLGPSVVLEQSPNPLRRPAAWRWQAGSGIEPGKGKTKTGYRRSESNYLAPTSVQEEFSSFYRNLGFPSEHASLS